MPLMTVTPALHLGILQVTLRQDSQLSVDTPAAHANRAMRLRLKLFILPISWSNGTKETSIQWQSGGNQPNCEPNLISTFQNITDHALLEIYVGFTNKAGQNRLGYLINSILNRVLRFESRQIFNYHSLWHHDSVEELNISNTSLSCYHKECNAGSTSH